MVLTVTEARRIVGGITGRPTGSLVLDRPVPAPAVPVHDAATAPTTDWAELRADGGGLHRAKPNSQEGAGRGEGKPQPTATPGPVATEPVQPPVFHVTARDGAEGRLIVDRRAGGVGLVLVAYASGIAEVNAADLRIVRVE